MNYEQWLEEYQPIPNPNGTSIGWDTHEDFEALKAYSPKQIWTMVNDGNSAIIAGCRWANRLEYYVTEKPWEDEYQEVTLGGDSDEF